MADLEKTINQAISDFDSIETAIEEMGIDVPMGTDTSEYGDLIRKIPSGGITVDQAYNAESENPQSGIAVAEALNALPIKYVVSPDEEGNTVYLRDLEGGIYVLQGIFRPYEGYDTICNFPSSRFCTVVKEISDDVATSYIQIFNPINNEVQFVELTDESCKITDVKLNEITTIATLATVAKSGSYNDLLNRPITDLGAFANSDDATTALNECKATNIYKYTVNNNRQSVFVISLRVIGEICGEIVQQIRFINTTDNYSGTPYLMEYRKYWYDDLDDTHLWSEWSNPTEVVDNKVNSILGVGNAFNYPTTKAVNDFVKNITDKKVEKESGKGLSTNDFANEHKEIVESSRDAFSNSLKATASGEVIRVDDVSPVEHTAKAKVSGKNLIYYPYYHLEHSVNGGTFTVQEDGGVIASGVPTDYVSLTIANNVALKTKGLITISIGGTHSNVSGDFVLRDNENKTVAAVYLTSSNLSQTINIDDYPNAVVYSFILKRAKANIEMTGVVYPQIEKGDTATEYEPYIDPTTVTVTRCGKNILDVNEADCNLSNASGWASIAYDKDYTKQILSPSTTYTMRFKATSVEDIPYATIHSYRIGFGLYDFTTAIYIAMATNGEGSVGEWLTKGKSIEVVGTFTTPNDLLEKEYTIIYYTQAAYLEDGTSVRNKLNFADIQIELGDTSTDFEAYNGTTHTPKADGTVDIVSVSPTMTLLTDTAGVNIEVEYNQDSNKAMDNVKEDIRTLDNSIAELAEDMGDVETALDGIIAIQNNLMGVSE